MSIYLYIFNYIFINFHNFSLVRRLCMLLRIASARWFCEVPSIYDLRPPHPHKKRRKKQDKYLNFVTEKCMFYSHKMALIT